MLRSAILSASRSATLKRLTTDFPLARKISRRFVAGESLDEAVVAARKLNAEGKLVSLDHLGENVAAEEEAVAAASAYLGALDAIGKHGLQANISVKLTQLGVDLDRSLCERLVRRIATRAARLGTTVTIDMEGSAYTQRTLDLYRRLHPRHGNLDAVVQAYLYRTEKDLKALIPLGVHVRLCKGAYQEPSDIAYPEKADVDKSYLRMTEVLLSGRALGKGVYPCIATHDNRIVQSVLRTVASRKIPTDAFEFQMLYGIRPELQSAIVRLGYRLRIYTPYGTQWYPYFMRRLAERPANLWFFVKNLV